MTITSVGSVATGESVGSNTTLNLDTQTDGSIGDEILVLIGLDNKGAETSDGETSNVTSVAWGSNTFTKLYEYTNAQTGALTGATASLWRCRLTANVTSGSTAGHTIDIVTSSSSGRTSATAWKFSSTSPLQVTASGKTFVAGDGANIAPSIALSGLPSLERLWVRITGAENTAAWTSNTGSWTSAGASSSGSGTSSMGVNAEFIISTATGVTSDPGSSATADCISILVALEESSQSSPVGVSSESDAAQVLGVARPADLAAETDAALALSGVGLRGAGMALETDLAQGLGVARPADRANETDSALALSAVQITTAGRADETDTALDLTPIQIQAIGRADETDGSLTPGAARPADVSTETDTANALGVARPAGLASEIDAAYALSAISENGVGTAVETNSARALSAVHIAAIGTTNETDTALALTALQIRAVGVAVETDTAGVLGSEAPGEPDEPAQPGRGGNWSYATEWKPRQNPVFARIRASEEPDTAHFIGTNYGEVEIRRARWLTGGLRLSEQPDGMRAKAFSVDLVADDNEFLLAA